MPLPLLRADEHEIEDREDRAVHEDHLRDRRGGRGLQERKAGDDGSGHDGVERE
jgi:hypothetical protein